MDKETLINKIAERILKSATDDSKVYMGAVREVIEQSIQGYSIVPDEPTDKMVIAGEISAGISAILWESKDFKRMYKAMIKAAKES